MSKTQAKRVEVSIGGFFGILAACVFVLSVAYSVYLSPWFSWRDNALSDLGVVEPSAWIFQMGMVGTGACAFVFGLGLFIYLPKRLRPASFAFMLGPIGLIGVGIYEAGIAHLLSVFFCIGMYAVGLLIVAHDRKNEKMGARAGLSFAVGVSSLLLLFFVEGFALTETVVLIAIASFILYLSFEMIKKR